MAKEYDFDNERLREYLADHTAGLMRNADSARDREPPRPQVSVPDFTSQAKRLASVVALFPNSILTADNFDDTLNKVLNTQSLDHPPEIIHGMAVELYKRRGDAFFRLQRTRDASHAYTMAVQKFAKADAKGILHRDEFLNTKSLAVSDNYLAGFSAQLSAAQAARCFYELHEYGAALDWATEVDVLQKHVQFSVMSGEKTLFEWESFGMPDADFYAARIRAYLVAFDTYSSLGNTSARTDCLWQAQSISENVPFKFSSSVNAVAPLPDLERVSETTATRHPDPGVVHRQKVIDASIQVRGSWRKLTQTDQIGSRFSVTSFVFEGTLYIFGGQKDAIGPFYRELWACDLESTARKWRQMPQYPWPKSGGYEDYCGLCFALDKENARAYLFRGSLNVAYFDLRSKQWARLKTTCSGTWPYPHDVRNYSAQVVDERLYIFGGRTTQTPVGTDLFMALNLKTLKWECLSGNNSGDDPSYSRPGLREWAASWVSKDKQKIFFFAGNADRMGAGMFKKKHGGDHSFDYDDLWSWNVSEKVWRRERVVGNRPSRRTEMSYVYNPVLDKFFIFGGYSPTVPTTNFSRRNTMFTFSYYADTFMLDSDDPSKSSFKHVITRGFPSYRALGQLVVDDQTGKTYLWGGYTNTQFVPQHKSSNINTTRNFTDLWELRVDVEGGGFEGVNLDEEARTAKAGPFCRCFNCESTGSWQKCGGTCKGKAFFCSQACLKEGWKEHKQRHGCRKV
ncbi:hypothetical protein CYLTODRAFT_400420 [Cylindrobasidium torrendii FP15055 ss-10]|uniref:Uncharacterized protein n=1 Tax=Cylindrobasidium torrendii FP15055 ss-10 TaxID=1314674 RepID=A0A0D7B4D0_9AGAR|nr:hypothetical protein CYLTODRAFT_400420 [Cylindrobasidium torrendii FP15055 ss-10]